MNQDKFIEIAHKAQNDAGSLKNFKSKVEVYMLSMEGISNNDPVAAFLAAILLQESSVEKAVESLDYYTAELSRAVNALESIYLD